MQNKNTTPTLIFAKEELLEKKKITSFLRTNNVEFTPKKNYYDDYEATIKVKNLTPTKQREVLQILQDQESLNKIDFMFNLLPSLSDNSTTKKPKSPSQSPKKSRTSSPSEKQVNRSEKENVNIVKQPSSSHSPSEREFPSSLDHLAFDSKVGSETQFKERSSPSRDLLHKVMENKEKSGKVSPQKRSLTNSESPKKKSPVVNKKSPPKSVSQKDVSSGRGYNSDGRLVRSYSKESKLEGQPDNQRLLAIASSLGKLHFDQAPTVSPFKIITETATSTKEQHEEVNSMQSYSIIETPTLGQQVYQSASKPNSKTSLHGNSEVRKSNQTLKKQDSYITSSKKSLSPDSSPKKSNSKRSLDSSPSSSPKKANSNRALDSKKSSTANLFTLRGEEIPKKNALNISGSSPNISQRGKSGSPQRNKQESEVHSSFEEYPEEDDTGDRFKQWTDVIMQDPFFRQLFSKIKENTGKSEAESLIILITMLQEQQVALENEPDESSMQMESVATEVSMSTKETKETKRTSPGKNNSPVRNKKKLIEAKSVKPTTSQSAVKSNKTTLINKSATKKTPMSSEKLNKQNPKLKESNSTTKKKEKSSVADHFNTSVSSSKGFLISINTEPIVEVDSKNDINNTGRFPQSGSRQIYQNPSANPAKTLEIEDNEDPSNLSLGPDHFEEDGRVSIYDGFSTIQHQEKSMDNTRGIFDTLDNHGFDMSFDEKDKKYKDTENFYGREARGEFSVGKERNMSPENIYKHNTQIMRNLNNIILKSPYNSAATSKKNSIAKVNYKSEHALNNSTFSSKTQSISIGSTSIRTAASSLSMLEEEKGKAERRRFTREKYNEYTRRIFQGLICNLSVKQERLGTKESEDVQAPYEQLDTEGMTKYFKLLLAKKNLLTIEQFRKKPQGETSLLLY